MNKRRLSNQQQTRIVEKQQRELAVSTGDSDSLAPAMGCNGRVISHFGQQVDVEPLSAVDAPANRAAGNPVRTTVRCYQRANLPSLVTGDLVAWEAGEAETGVIVALGERTSVFGRPAFDGNFKPMASNIDKVLVVLAPLPEPFMNLIDRYLVAIETLNLEAVLVLNKADLTQEIEKQGLDNMLSLYESLGYEVHRVSAESGSGLTELLESLRDQTSVLVGQSGVGKSSLLNSFGIDDKAAVGALSEAKSKGTHTTTTARLFHLQDCDLIDSPGIREFSLGHIDQAQLFAGFREFRAIPGQCKFRDCQHRSEPGCAILLAVTEGKLSQQRLDSYFQILQSMETTDY